MVNKISPPDQAFTDGRRPGDAYAAQWQNYVDFYFQKQIERSANVPFQNWLDFSEAIPATTATPRFAFNRNAGLTLVANGANNSIKYIQQMVEGSTGAPLGITLSPAAGTFVPKCVVALENQTLPCWFVGGTNTTAPTKTVWEVDQNGTLTEMTMPVSGSVENITSDPTTPGTTTFYAVSADANRTVSVRTSGSFSVLGTLGGGVATPTSSTTFLAAHGGTVVYATSGTPDVQITYIVSPGTLGTTRVLTGDSSTVLDCRYSLVLGKFMVLTTTHLLLFVDPAQPVYESFPHIGLGGGGVTMGGGCCTDTGCAVWTNGDGALLYVTTWPGDVPYANKFGAFSGSIGSVARYDGSAIWFLYDTSGTKHLWRSLRAN